MTYYELVSYLDNLIYAPVGDKEIEYLNNINVSLSKDRYLRFIEQVSYLISERLKRYFNNIMDKLGDKFIDCEELTIELSRLTDEINIVNRLASVKLIQIENQNEFKKSIINGNNIIIDNIRKVFENDDERLNIVNSYELKEID